MKDFEGLFSLIKLRLAYAKFITCFVLSKKKQMTEISMEAWKKLEFFYLPFQEKQNISPNFVGISMKILLEKCLR